MLFGILGKAKQISEAWPLHLLNAQSLENALRTNKNANMFETSLTVDPRELEESYRFSMSVKADVFSMPGKKTTSGAKIVLN